MKINNHYYWYQIPYQILPGPKSAHIPKKSEAR